MPDETRGGWVPLGIVEKMLPVGWVPLLLAPSPLPTTSRPSSGREGHGLCAKDTVYVELRGVSEPAAVVHEQAWMSIPAITWRLWQGRGEETDE
jgi:hypothetical protein